MKTKKNKGTASSKLLVLAILTTIIFVVLQLTHVITWHWVWVFAPLWGSITLNMVISLLFGIVDDIRNWNEINRIK